MEVKNQVCEVLFGRFVSGVLSASNFESATFFASDTGVNASKVWKLQFVIATPEFKK